MLKKALTDVELWNEEFKDKICELQIRLRQATIEYSNLERENRQVLGSIDIVKQNESAMKN